MFGGRAANESDVKVNPMLTPLDFSDAWGASRLVRLPRGTKEPAVPAEALSFLVEAGLPANFVFAHPELPSRVSFDRLSRGLWPVVAEAMVGPAPPPDWISYLVLGEERFENGGAWYCIHQGTGRVVRIDPELESPLSIVNTTVPRFATAMLAATSWSAALGSPSAATWAEAVSHLEGLLSAADPAALGSPTCYWKLVLRAVAEEAPGAFRFLSEAA